MIRVRSSTLFHLLCWAIGVMAVGLLAMVVLMVLPLVVSSKETSGSTAEFEPPPPAAREAPVDQVARTWHMRFWPPEAEEEEEETELGDAVDSAAGFRYVGNVFDGNGEGYAFLQREGTGRQLMVHSSRPEGNIRIRTLAENYLVAQIDEQVVKLRLVGAKAPRSRRGQSSPRRAGTNQSGSSARGEITSTSYHVASGGSSNSQNGSSTSSGSRRQGQTTRAGRNWRRYWAERMRRNRQRE